MATIFVIAFSGTGSTASGAGEPAALPSADTGRYVVAAPEKCPSARGAVRFYQRRLNEWRAKMGAAQSGPRDGAKLRGCPRYLAHVLQRKAYAARRAYARWVAYHYHWWKWMPAKLQRVGACETGYGRRPGDFHWDSGLYVSYAGIIRDGYATFAHRLGLLSWDESRRRRGMDPTPREQVRVTLALQSEYGWGAWGCGGA